MFDPDSSRETDGGRDALESAGEVARILSSRSKSSLLSPEPGSISPGLLRPEQEICGPGLRWEGPLHLSERERDRPGSALCIQSLLRVLGARLLSALISVKGYQELIT